MNDWALEKCCFSLLPTEQRISISDYWQQQWLWSHSALRECWDGSPAVLIILVLNSKSNSKTGGDCWYQIMKKDSEAGKRANPAALIITSTFLFRYAPKHSTELIQSGLKWKATLKSDARMLKSVQFGLSLQIPHSCTHMLQADRQGQRSYDAAPLRLI